MDIIRNKEYSMRLPQTHQTAVETLSNKFNINYFQENISTDEPLSLFLSTLENKLKRKVGEKGDEYFQFLDKETARAASQLVKERVFDSNFGIDYNLDLVGYEQLINEDNYPFTYYCLIKLPKFTDEGLVKENHNYGCK